MQFKDLGSTFSSFGDLSGKRFKSDIYDGIQNMLSLKQSLNVNDKGISEFTTAQIEAKTKVWGFNEEMTKQALAFANDATLATRAADKTLTYGNAIKENLSYGTELAKILKDNGKINDKGIAKLSALTEGTKEYNEAVKTIIEDSQDISEAIVEIPASADTAGKAITGLSNYFKGLIATLKTFAPVILAVTAAIAAYSAWKWADNKYNLTYSTSLKNVKEHVSNLQNAQKEIDSLNSKADQYKQTLEEIASNYNVTLEGTESVDEMIQKIQSADGIQLSLIDQTEIEKIKLGNDELERTIKLKQQVISSEERDAAEAAKANISNGLFNRGAQLKLPGYAESKDNIFSLFTGHKIKTDSLKSQFDKLFTNPGKGMEFETDEENRDMYASISSYLNYYNSYKELLEKAKDIQADDSSSKKAKQNAKNDEEFFQGLLDEMDSTLQEKASDLQNDLYGLSEGGEGLVALTGYEPYFEKIKKMLNAITYKDASEAQKALSSLSTFFDGSFGKNALKAELKESAGSAEELQKALAGMGLTLDDLGINNISDLQSYLQEAASSAEDAADAINTVEGSVASVTSAFNVDNQDASWKTMAEYLAQADELFANGQIGTDDFKEATQFMTQKKINPDDGFTFDAQAYEAAWKEAQDKVKRYFDNEDQFQSAENFLTDLQNVGLAIADGNNDFQWTENFNSSADAANKLGISVSAVEVLMHNLEAYGAEFNDMVWSGDELDQYKSALNGIKTIYDSMEEGATKDRYKKLIDGWDEELAGYENDLSTLTDHDVVVNIQFQYSLASIQQQIDELQNTADEGGDNQTWAELNASKKQYLKQAESANTSDVANLDAYKEAASYIDELKENLSNATDENTKNAIQRQISSVYDAMKYMNDAFIDSGKSWAEYYQSDQYKSDYKNFGDQLHANGVIDVDADTTKAKEKVDNLTEDTDNKSTTIDIDANIENAKTALENLKNDDGTLDLGNINVLQAYNALKDLLIEKQELEQPAVMTIDTSKFSEESTETINKLQEFQKAYEDLNAQNQMKDMGFDIDTSEAEKKVQDLYSDLKDNDLVASLNINTDDVNSFEQSLDKLSEKEIKMHVDGDTSKLDAAMENSVPAEKTVTMSPKLDGTQVSQFFDWLNDLLAKNTDLSVNATVTGQDQVSELSDSIDNVKNKDVDVTGNVKGTDLVDALFNAISGVKSKTVSVGANVFGTGEVSLLASAIKGVVSKVVSVGANIFGFGKHKVNGTAHSLGTAYASGNWGAKESSTSLVGELGTEIVVDPATSTWRTVGDNGAEFVNIKKGQIVFNNRQSEELLKNGYVTSGGGRGKIQGGSFASGTALVLGNGSPGIHKNTGVMTSEKNKDKTSSSKSSSGSSSSGSSTRASSNSRSSSGDSTRSSSGGSSTKEATEETFDWIEVFLKEMSRATEIAVDNIDRAIGLAQKQTKAYDAISKVQQELTANQQSANKYLQLAANVGLDPSYISKIQNGTLDVEKVTNEDLKKKIDEYKDYYSKYESAADNVAKLEDKITELAEKRLEIIEKEYDAIVDINDKIKDVADSKISLNDALGVAIDNPDNYANLNNSIKAQEDTYNQLTKKLSDYQKEMESQLSSGLMQKGSDAYNSALKNIQDFTAKIYEAATSAIELKNKLDQIKIDVIQYKIDEFQRNSDRIDAYTSLRDAQDETVSESMYQNRIDNNNGIIEQKQKQREIYLKNQSYFDVNSKEYQSYADKIKELDTDTINLMKDNEDLKDSIFELRFKNLDDAIQKYSDLEDELKSFRDLLNDDAFLDKQGRITEEGLAQVALLQQSIGTAKQKIADYTTGLQKLKESYDNGVISLTEYNDKSKDYREGIQGSIADVKSYQDSLVDLYKNAMSTEVDYLDKIISKRKEALTQQKDMYDYSKKINSQNNNINSLKAQIMALEGVKYLLL